MKRSVFAIALLLFVAFIIALISSNTRCGMLQENLDALTQNEHFNPDVQCFSSVSDDYDPDLFIEVRECSSCSIVATGQASSPSTCSPS